MENLSYEMREDYSRTCKKIPLNETYSDNEMDYHSILKAHYFICDYFESNYHTKSLFGVRDFNLLSSAIARQKTSFGGHTKWETQYEIMATLFFGLIKNHPFHDGNKRTALLTLLFHLYQKNRVPSVQEKVFENLTVHVAESNYASYKEYKQFTQKYSESDAQIYFLANFIEKKTRQSESKYKAITYHEFNTKLGKYNCFLAAPSGNYINVYNAEKKKVLQIGFPGWKKQIRAKAQKETLKALKLTKEYGIDSKVFFEDTEPIYCLIEKYEKPLSRLKDE